MKLFLFLREIYWTSVLAVIGSIASIVLVFFYQPLVLPVAAFSIVMAILAPRRGV